MKLVFEKKIQLYKKYLQKGELTDRMDRLTLENKKEWALCHLLGLIKEQEAINKFSELTKRIYRLEKKTAGLDEY